MIACWLEEIANLPGSAFSAGTLRGAEVVQGMQSFAAKSYVGVWSSPWFFDGLALSGNFCSS